MIRVQHEDFDIGAEIEALTGGNNEIGAVASFVGITRADAGAGPQRPHQRARGLGPVPPRRTAHGAEPEPGDGPSDQFAVAVWRGQHPQGSAAPPG